PEVLQQLLGRARLHVVFAGEALDGGRRRKTEHLARELADRQAELERPPGPIALPERRLARLAGGGRHEHAVVRDFLDAPGRAPRQNRLAGGAFEPLLFGDSAHAGAAGPRPDEKPAVEPAARNRSAVRDRDALRAVARADGPRHAVPRDART